MLFDVTYVTKAPRQQTFLFDFNTADKTVTEPTLQLRQNGIRFLNLNVSRGEFLAGQSGCVKATRKVNTETAGLYMNDRGTAKSAACDVCKCVRDCGTAGTAFRKRIVSDGVF